MEILLNEDIHQYTVDGVVKPSVTEVLETLIEVEALDVFVDTTTHKHIPGDMIRQAGDFGRAFHVGAKYIVEGKHIKYDPSLEQAFSELRRWRTEYAIETVASETRVYCPKLDVCGTLDWIGSLTRNRVLNLVDWKTSKASAGMVGPQTWAYESGYRHVTGYKGIIKRWAWVFDKAKGKYDFYELKDPYDEHYFRAMNLGYKWRRR